MRLGPSLAGVVIVCGTSHDCVAASIPAWAEGHWQAVSIIASADVSGWGAGGRTSLERFLAKTQMTIDRRRLRMNYNAGTLLISGGGSRENGEFYASAEFVDWSQRISPLKDMLSLPEGNVVIGRGLASDLPPMVSYLRVTVRDCGRVEQPGAVFSRGHPIPPERQVHCGPIDIYRFPDNDHVAVRNDVSGWAIFSRT